MRRIVLAAALLALPLVSQAYSFTITNKSQNTIVAVEVSEDGETWGNFSGNVIEPGDTVAATWDQSTDDSNCEWFLRAKYDDGSESEAAAFDFCEEDLAVEFDD